MCNYRTVLAFVFGLCFAGSAVANGGLYGGVQYGILTSEDADMGNIGLTAGGVISDYLSIEGTYTFTISEEDLGGGVDLSSSSIGVFAVFKSQGDFYGKGRVGFSKVDFDMEILGFTFTDDASGLAFGAGIGVKVGAGAIEIEYTKLPDLDTFQGIPVDASNDFLSVGYVKSF
jgi:hypothetical protein